MFHAMYTHTHKTRLKPCTPSVFKFDHVSLAPTPAPRALAQLRVRTVDPHWRCVINAAARSAGDPGLGLSEDHQHPAFTPTTQDVATVVEVMNWLAKRSTESSSAQLTQQVLREHTERKSPSAPQRPPALDRLHYSEPSMSTELDNPSNVQSFPKSGPQCRLLTAQGRSTDKRRSSCRLSIKWISELPANNPGHVARITRSPILFI